jgi:endonuclease/exonuclease/phosphatase family metal-dependent hydrolase/uncharacterized protein YdeI (BOF family)
VNWIVEYGIGDTPTTFSALTTSPTTLTTGSTAFSNTTVNANFGTALDNITTSVWIRIRTAGTSTGSGNRPTTAIDDFILNYSTTDQSPAINISTDTIRGFLTNQGTPSVTKSYIVSGLNLTNSISLTAPEGFEISLNKTTLFVTTLLLIPESGNVASTTIYVRLKGTTQGAFSGNITHTSNGTTTKLVYVEGKVNPPPVRTTIANAKTLPDERAVIVQGRLTVSAQFGGRLVYVQDTTGGLAVFSNNATAYPTGWQIGDLVEVTGNMATFNGKREIIDPTSVTIVSGQTNQPVAPKLIPPDKLGENEGLLVKIENMNFTVSGNFAANTNYQSANCENVFATVRINSSANPLATTAIPINTRTITGIVEVFNGAYQLMPRLTTDMAVAEKQCPLTATCNPTATVIPDNGTSRNTTLDIVTWNVDWLGHTGAGFGPANDTLQQANIGCISGKFNADIIVLQEVCDTSKLSKILPMGFKYKCSTQYYSHFYDDPETAADPAQKVCVAYNPVTISPIDTACRAILTDKAEFTVSSPTNSFWASGRLPYMFTANATIDGTTQRFRLIGLHAKAGSALGDYTRRVADVQALKAEIDAKYSKENVIIAGDFNDDLDQSITTGQPSSYVVFVRDTVNYFSVTKALSDAGRRSTGNFSDMVDHIIVSNELKNAYIANSAGVSSGAGLFFIGAYNATTTDHFPVWASFNLKRSTKVKNIRETGLGIKSVYPNPAMLMITLEYTSDITGDVSIKNLLGTTVYSKKRFSTEGGREQIDVSAFPAGVYWITVPLKDGVSTVSFVKQ